ncbi:MAG: tripartite tricarboxylate transporter TctB family protein [Rhodospirillales bacterium]|jgi:hypothetical protein
MQRYMGDVIAGIVFIGIAGWIVWYSWDFPAGGQKFSNFAAVSIILMAIVMIAKAILSKEPEMKRLMNFDFSWSSNKQYYIALLVIIYWSISFVIGYFVATLLFLVIAAWMSGIRDIKVIAITAVILLPALYGFFILILQADMPEGMFF